MQEPVKNYFISMDGANKVNTVDDGSMMEDDGPAFIDQAEIVEEYDLGDGAGIEEEGEEEEEAEAGAHAMEMAEGEDDAIVDMSSVRFTGHSDFVYCVAHHPTQHIAVSGGGDDKAFLWSTDDGTTLHELSGHTDTVVAVGFSSDGKYVATGGYEGIVKIWVVATGALHLSLEGPTEQVEWLQWHKKGNVVVAGSSDGTAWMWLADTGACMQVFAGHEAGVTCGTFTSSGKLLATGSEDGTVRLWNPKNGTCIHVFQGHGFHEGPVTTIRAHPSEPLLLTGAQDGTGCLLKVDAKRILGRMRHAGVASGATAVVREGEEDENLLSVETVGFCATNPWVATGGVDGNVRVWDTAQLACRLVLSHEDSTVVKIVWHPSKPFLYSVCADGGVREWDARSGECVRTLTGHKDIVQDLLLQVGGNGDMDVIFTASDDQTCRIFHI